MLQRVLALLRLCERDLSGADLSVEVVFEPVDGPVNDHIDDAYRAKYRGSPYLKPMIGAHARSATVKVMPRKSDA